MRCCSLGGAAVDGCINHGRGLQHSSWYIPRYLADEHDPTTVGLLLGTAASKRGSGDAVLSKMLFLHVPGRHPASYPEFEVSALVQAAAVMGLGLLYQQTCNR